MADKEPERQWLVPGQSRRMRRGTLAIAATAAASVAVTTVVFTATGAASRRPSLLLESPPSSLAAALDGARIHRAQKRDSAAKSAKRRAQLVAMAERAVERLAWHIVGQDHQMSMGAGKKKIEPGGSRFSVANTPQLAGVVPADDVFVGGRHFVKSQMLSAIDQFFESDENKLLVAQAIEEEALEKENGGQGEGTEVMAANALERLETGDTEFENEWANAGEKVTASAAANRATHDTYKYMIERDLGHAREEFNSAKAEAGAAMELLQQKIAEVSGAEQQLAAAQQTQAQAEAAILQADQEIAAAEAQLAALDQEAESYATLSMMSGAALQGANNRKAQAQAEKTAADAAVSQAETAKADAEAAMQAQQAVYDEKLAIQRSKQAIMEKMLEAHKALACDPNKLAAVEPYTIEMQEAGACEFPADASRVQFAITQAEAAAEEARHRAEIEGLMSEQAWWQKALEELGDSKPAIDKAHEAWDEAIAMKEAEAAA